jgi:hypothetical protein
MRHQKITALPDLEQKSRLLIKATQNLVRGLSAEPGLGQLNLRAIGHLARIIEEPLTGIDIKPGLAGFGQVLPWMKDVDSLDRIGQQLRHTRFYSGMISSILGEQQRLEEAHANPKKKTAGSPETAVPEVQVLETGDLVGLSYSQINAHPRGSEYGCGTLVLLTRQGVIYCQYQFDTRKSEQDHYAFLIFGDSDGHKVPLTELEMLFIDLNRSGRYAPVLSWRR